MLNKSIFHFFFLFLFSFAIFASDCLPAKIKIINLQKEVVSQETICFLPPSINRITYIVSESCAKKKCEILQRKKRPLIIKNYMKNFGSPGFKLCDALGGSPQIFEYLIKKDSFQNTERCLFGKKDFVEIALLSNEWKSFVSTKKKD